MKTKSLMAVTVVVSLAWLILPLSASAAAPHADETHGTPAATTRSAHHADHYPAYDHPTLPRPHTVWPGVMMLVVIGMFVGAVGVGIVVMLNMPDEPPPPAHSHDEHSSDDHAHGGHTDPHHGHH